MHLIRLNVPTKLDIKMGNHLINRRGFSCVPSMSLFIASTQTKSKVKFFIAILSLCERNPLKSALT